MNARCFLFLLGILVSLTACLHKAPLLAATERQPEIIIHAPKERVRVSIVKQEVGEGSVLASQSENRLIFVRQVPRPTAILRSVVRPSGAAYVRSIYTLSAERPNTEVTLRAEIVYDYGTDSERAARLETSELRREQQRELLRLKTVIEKL